MHHAAALVALVGWITVPFWLTRVIMKPSHTPHYPTETAEAAGEVRPVGVPCSPCPSNSGWGHSGHVRAAGTSSTTLSEDTLAILHSLPFFASRERASAATISPFALVHPTPDPEG